MPNTDQKADATLIVVQDDFYHQRRQAAHRVVQAHAKVNKWPEDDIARVMGSLGLAVLAEVLEERA